MTLAIQTTLEALFDGNSKWMLNATIITRIPHSIFGSEFDYTTGQGHGTAG